MSQKWRKTSYNITYIWNLKKDIEQSSDSPKLTQENKNKQNCPTESELILKSLYRTYLNVVSQVSSTKLSKNKSFQHYTILPENRKRNYPPNSFHKATVIMIWQDRRKL